MCFIGSRARLRIAHCHANHHGSSSRRARVHVATRARRTNNSGRACCACCCCCSGRAAAGGGDGLVEYAALELLLLAIDARYLVLQLDILVAAHAHLLLDVLDALLAKQDLVFTHPQCGQHSTK